MKYKLVHIYDAYLTTLCLLINCQAQAISPFMLQNNVLPMK